MKLHFELPWERYALIAEIVKRFQAANFRLGKTALQKMVFLLQRAFGVEIDYQYTLYTYGPYCADVARDLDTVAVFGGAQVLCDLSFGGYVITPGPTNEEIRERSRPFLDGIGSQLDRLVSTFGSFNAKELELRSTIIFLSKPGLLRQDLIRQVFEVKPHFAEATIAQAVGELEALGYVHF
ncbi:MAG: hypothetical protein LLG20_04080 [Acidobacteriales bacterium]|nr:hypothetical protein [Terriglobales bacterium]